MVSLVTSGACLIWLCSQRKSPASQAFSGHRSPSWPGLRNGFVEPARSAGGERSDPVECWFVSIFRIRILQKRTWSIWSLKSILENKSTRKMSPRRRMSCPADDPGCIPQVEVDFDPETVHQSGALAPDVGHGTWRWMMGCRSVCDRSNNTSREAIEKLLGCDRCPWKKIVNMLMMSCCFSCFPVCTCIIYSWMYTMPFLYMLIYSNRGLGFHGLWKLGNSAVW